MSVNKLIEDVLEAILHDIRIHLNDWLQRASVCIRYLHFSVMWCLMSVLQRKMILWYLLLGYSHPLTNYIHMLFFIYTSLQYCCRDVICLHQTCFIQLTLKQSSYVDQAMNLIILSVLVSMAWAAKVQCGHY